MSPRNVFIMKIQPTKKSDFSVNYLKIYPIPKRLHTFSCLGMKIPIFHERLEKRNGLPGPIGQGIAGGDNFLVLIRHLNVITGGFLGLADFPGFRSEVCAFIGAGHVGYIYV